MTKQRSQLRLLLLQIRDDAITCEEELNEFIRYSHLEAAQFTVLNVFETPVFNATCMEGFDALLVGGSSDASVTQPEQYPFVEHLKRLLKHCLHESIPVFASCFGFQAAIEALGGQVIVDVASMEMGTYPLQLTEAALTDELFYDVPNGFWAVLGHKERAVSLPEEAVLLASSALCPYQAFRVAGKPFYAFQFHPEIDPPDLRVRLTRYQSRYFDSTATLATMLQDLQETPIANQLVKKFIDRILLA
ncbi:type 1 glutamine amidotransferase [Phormidium sp. FACHB-592]|uniref:Type 1 glutamine amidotransferase n=1 Tax=Stenomitos frigidus AS-A4 TaxID=2933935 RepID=A0ABV0KL86_9CYAN|nr:type 1 glutamine amidotransferase [Phormidium sp. FACHB-592]MBD2073260.1 type 1 glutamine amidotransferase [Phormidium sp. FACHB-592]